MEGRRCSLGTGNLVCGMRPTLGSATGAGGPRTLEFRKDGTYTEVSGDLTTRGTWEVTDGSQLTLSMEVMGESLGTTFRMEFHNGDLMLDFTQKDAASGSAMRYKRVE